MLAHSLRTERLPRGAHVLDLCTGSGLLAVTAALRGAARVVAVDVSGRALVSAWLNARLNGVRVEARRGDLFDAVAGERFDVITSNPPYLPGPSERLPQGGAARAWEGGVSGRVFIDRICDRAHEHLRQGGSLLLLHSSVCGIPQTLAQLDRHGLEATVVFRHRGPLGPLLQARADWLRAGGRLLDGDEEDVVVIRATQRPNVRSSRRPRAGASAMAARASDSPARSSGSPTSTGSIESWSSEMR